MFVYQAIAHLMSVAMIIRAHSAPSTLASSVLIRPWFFVLVLAGAIERLCGLALGVAVERDWVVLVFLLASVHVPYVLNDIEGSSNLKSYLYS